MRGHIIWTLISVGQIMHAWIIRWRNQAGKIALQIALHLGVCVFLDQQTCRRMLDKQCDHTCAMDPIAHFICKFIQPLPLRRNFENLVGHAVGASKMMQVVVPVAYNLDVSTSSIRPWATTVLRPE